MLESEKEPKTTYNTQKSAEDQKEVLIENLIRCLSQEKNSSLEVDRLLNSSDLPPEEILQEALAYSVINKNSLAASKIIQLCKNKNLTSVITQKLSELLEESLDFYSEETAKFIIELGKNNFIPVDVLEIVGRKIEGVLNSFLGLKRLETILSMLKDAGIQLQKRKISLAFEKLVRSQVTSANVSTLKVLIDLAKKYNIPLSLNSESLENELDQLLFSGSLTSFIKVVNFLENEGFHLEHFPQSLFSHLKNEAIRSLKFLLSHNLFSSAEEEIAFLEKYHLPLDFFLESFLISGELNLVEKILELAEKKFSLHLPEAFRAALERLLADGKVSLAKEVIELAKSQSIDLDLAAIFQEGLSAYLLKKEVPKLEAIIQLAKNENINLDLETIFEKQLKFNFFILNFDNVKSLVELIAKWNLPIDLSHIFEQWLSFYLFKNWLNSAKNIIILAEKLNIQVNLEAAFQKSLEVCFLRGDFSNSKKIISLAHAHKIYPNLNEVIKKSLKFCLQRGDAKGAEKILKESERKDIPLVLNSSMINAVLERLLSEGKVSLAKAVISFAESHNLQLDLKPIFQRALSAYLLKENILEAELITRLATKEAINLDLENVCQKAFLVNLEKESLTGIEKIITFARRHKIPLNLSLISRLNLNPNELNQKINLVLEKLGDIGFQKILHFPFFTNQELFKNLESLPLEALETAKRYLKKLNIQKAEEYEPLIVAFLENYIETPKKENKWENFFERLNSDFNQRRFLRESNHPVYKLFILYRYLKYLMHRYKAKDIEELKNLLINNPKAQKEMAAIQLMEMLKKKSSVFPPDEYFLEDKEYLEKDNESAEKENKMADKHPLYYELEWIIREETRELCRILKEVEALSKNKVVIIVPNRRAGWPLEYLITDWQEDSTTFRSTKDAILFRLDALLKEQEGLDRDSALIRTALDYLQEKRLNHFKFLLRGIKVPSSFDGDPEGFFPKKDISLSRYGKKRLIKILKTFPEVNLIFIDGSQMKKTGHLNNAMETTKGYLEKKGLKNRSYFLLFSTLKDDITPLSGKTEQESMLYKIFSGGWEEKHLPLFYLEENGVLPANYLLENFKKNQEARRLQLAKKTRETIERKINRIFRKK